MDPSRDPRTIGARIETLLEAFADPDAQQLGERLTGLLVDYYGEALSRIVEVLEQAGDGGQELLVQMAADDFVGALLVLHDLHPETVETRVLRALDAVRPYLGSHAGGVEVLGFEPDDQTTGVVVNLHLSGSCDGCPSSLVTVKTAIETAIFDAAPEVSRVEVENLHQNPEPTLLQIQPCPTQELAIGAAR
jgi:Fe-S cluster biogenesis protein NfuA